MVCAETIVCAEGGGEAAVGTTTGGAWGGGGDVTAGIGISSVVDDDPATGLNRSFGISEIVVWARKEMTSVAAGGGSVIVVIDADPPADPAGGMEISSISTSFRRVSKISAELMRVSKFVA